MQEDQGSHRSLGCRCCKVSIDLIGSDYENKQLKMGDSICTFLLDFKLHFAFVRKIQVITVLPTIK